MGIKIENSITPVVADDRYLKINQAVPQKVINGVPTFQEGTIHNGDVIIRAGKRLVLDG